jgi:hypothetical protein
VLCLWLLPLVVLLFEWLPKLEGFAVHRVEVRGSALVEAALRLVFFPSLVEERALCAVFPDLVKALEMTPHTLRTVSVVTISRAVDHVGAECFDTVE